MSEPKVTRVGEVTIALGEGKPEAGEKPATSPAYRNVVSKNNWPSEEGANTLFQLFERSCQKYFDCKCIGWRPIKTVGDGDVKQQTSKEAVGDYVFWTYQEVRERVAIVASGMKAAGVPSHGKVGMYAINCPEWMLVLQACNRLALACVPLYDSFGESAVEYVVNHAEVSIIFTAADKLRLLAKCISKIKDSVKNVICFGSPDEDLVQQVKDQGVNVLAWDELLDLGKEKPSEAEPPRPEDTACIMYTSGTTGNPKGVLLTHRNLVTQVASLAAFAQQAGLTCSSNDSMLSYLTLAHIFDRLVEEFALSVGASIGYWQGDVKKITDDVMALKPTLFVAVPRVLERIMSGIQHKVKQRGVVLSTVINWAIAKKAAILKDGSIPVDKAAPLLDSWIFSAFKKGFGGRLRFVVSGGAPLSPHVEEYLKVVLCAPVLQGYGLTETCAASFLNLPKAGMSGTVGPPLPGMEFRLEGSKELGYDPLEQPPRGEVCIRGPTVFEGYYKDEEKTKEAFDADGWFHTGDVGELTEAGVLKIIDRIKNMFKLAQGEYVAAERLETVYSQDELVGTVWVYGNSYESVLVAVVVPEPHALKEWAAKEGVSGDVAEICKTDKARQKVLESLTKTGRSQKLKGFEIIKAVHLEPREWTTDDDLITTSLKLKRNKLQRKYQAEIDDMYKQLKAQGGGN